MAFAASTATHYFLALLYVVGLGCISFFLEMLYVTKLAAAATSVPLYACLEDGKKPASAVRLQHNK